MTGVTKATPTSVKHRLLLAELKTLQSKIYKMGFSVEAEDVGGIGMQPAKKKKCQDGALAELEKIMDEVAKKGKTEWEPFYGEKS
jgi:hypothetical protein